MVLAGDDESDVIVLFSSIIEWQWTQQLTQTSVWEWPYLESCSTPIGKYSASETPGWSRSPETNKYSVDLQTISTSPLTVTFLVGWKCHQKISTESYFADMFPGQTLLRNKFTFWIKWKFPKCLRFYLADTLSWHPDCNWWRFLTNGFVCNNNNQKWHWHNLRCLVIILIIILIIIKLLFTSSVNDTSGLCSKT